MIMSKICMNMKETSIINKLLKYNMHKTMDKLMARTRILKIIMKKKKKKTTFQKIKEVTFQTNLCTQMVNLLMNRCRMKINFNKMNR